MHNKSVKIKRDFSKWRFNLTGSAYLFFLSGYVGSNLYIGLILCLLASAKYTGFDALGVVGLFMQFLYPLMMICAFGLIILGCIFSLFSLNVGPLLLSLTNYLIFRKELKFGFISQSEIYALLRGGEITETLETTLLFNVLIILLLIQWFQCSIKNSAKTNTSDFLPSEDD